jgi:hypothetical protein
MRSNIHFFFHLGAIDLPKLVIVSNMFGRLLLKKLSLQYKSSGEYMNRGHWSASSYFAGRKVSRKSNLLKLPSEPNNVGNGSENWFRDILTTSEGKKEIIKEVSI